VQQVVDSSGRTPYDLAMGRYPAAYLGARPEPLVETGKLLAEECAKVDGCVIAATVEGAVNPVIPPQ
jgi:hypothetical protein